jgi:PAS domain S-box-containing protein
MNNDKRIRILLVEDSDHDALALRRALRLSSEADFELDHVQRAEAVVKRLGAEDLDHDVAVFDFNLPGMSGLDAGVQVLQWLPHMPLVLLTGEGSEDLAVQALHAGFYDYVVKDPRAGYLKVLPILLKDVVQRNRRDKLLRQNQERYFRLVENSPAIHYSFSEAKGGFYVSKRVEEILGYTRQYLQDNPFIWYGSIHPDDKHVVDKAIAGLKNNVHFNIEYRIRKADGQWKWLRDRSIGFTPEDDQNYMVEGLAMDITQEKRLEELKEDIQRISSHDLRTPLAGIISTAALLAEETGGDCALFAEKILSSGYRMMDMLSRSLDLYKMEAGTFDPTLGCIDIGKVIRDVVQDLTGQGTFQGRKLAVHLCGDHVRGDESLCWSIVANLLKNALEAGTSGDMVTITCTPSDQAVTLEIHNPQPVPQEIRDNFFGKYSTKGKKHGTGLGTYSAKLMTEAMGGVIEMRSSELDGTRVRVTLDKASPGNADES